MKRMVLICVLWHGAALASAAQVVDAPVRFETLRRFEGVGTHRVAFAHLTIEDGLSQNAVYALLQDRRGFMWIGTKDGLNRYDGSSFTVLRHDPFNPATISSSYVTELLEDSRGRFWVGTQDGGLSRLDRATGRALRYARSPRSRITALAEDAGGDLWVGTSSGGAFRLRRALADRPDAPFERHAHSPGNPRTLPDDYVTSILADRGGAVWFGTASGLSRLDANGRDFRTFDGNVGGGGLPDSFVTALAETRSGELWVGTPAGLARVAGTGSATPRFVSYPYLTARRGYLWGNIHEIREGPDGALWLATSDGLVRFDRVSGRYTYHLHDPLDSSTLSGNTLAALTWDRTGVLWVGANGYGVNRYDSKTARFETLRRPADRDSRWDGFSVRALFRDNSGALWLSAGGLYRYDRRGRTLVSFEQSSDRPRDFGNTGVWSIAQDRRQRLWFATYEGLYRYDPTAGTARLFAHEPAVAGGLPEKIVYWVHEARDGAIWAVTAHFISRLDDPDTGRFTSFRHSPAAHDVDDGLFPSVHEDERGRFWMATELGLVRFDPRNGTVRRLRTDPNDPASLSNDHVRAITPDPREPRTVLWVGTAGGGLNRLDLRTGRFTRVTVRDGLPNNVVYGVRPDSRGRLWLSTNRGLARYDPATREVRTYDVHDGLQSNEFNAGSSFSAHDGRLFFGGINGVTSFHPDSLADNESAPPVVVTSLRRAGVEELPGARGGLLVRPMSETDTLRLSHRDNVFTFEFAALDFSAPERNLYSYRMEGFDDGWTAPAPGRSATYTNLPPGRYTFHVRASNNDGVWNTQGASVTVLIAAPWWRTWWAYAAYVLLATAGGWSLARYRRNRLLLKHRLEIESVEAQKLRELDRSRSRFFANVSHEFRTPLTLTLGPLDDLRAGLHGPLSPPMAEQVDLARRNAGRVLDLINQILDVARLEAGRMPLRARRLDLGAFAERCAQSFAPAAERKTLALDIRVPAAPLEVWADPEHLEKVLVNLLSNAVKFTPAGGTVRLAVSAQGATARVEVRDSGPGIPAADLPHVFDRFHRVDEASTRSQPGTGIGLALARELVDLHAGTLTVSSEVGFGSVFTVTLPLGRNHLAPDQVVEEEVERWAPLPLLPLDEPAGDGAAGAPEPVPADETEDVTTVLIVEDNPDVRAYVRRHLVGDYRVVEASNGRQGLEKARSVLPDLVVSDIMMPDMDGLELCRALKGDPDTGFIPIILLTARAAPEDRLEGLREHCDEYLTKPFDPAELLARIENLIGQRRRLRERYASEAAGRAPRRGLHPDHVDPRSSNEAFLERVRDVVQEHMGDDAFSVERLAAGVGLSRAHLHRRLRELLEQSPSEVIRSMRLERAAELLRAQAGSVSEVAYAVGFKSVAHFSNAFRARYGRRPSAFSGELGAPQE